MDSYSEPDHSSQELPPQASGWRDAFTKFRRFRRLSIAESMLISFSPAERLLLYIFAALLAVSVLAMVVAIDEKLSVSVPARGGSLVEGEVGPVRFINPLLTISQPDEDLTALVYSGLMRALPDGSIVPDLASGYTLSPDGTVYTFTIRANAKFQDGTPVTAADVMFTVKEAQDPNLKSPREADWAGVTVSSPDPHMVVFTLAHAYEPFIEDTTLGILPAHLWQNVSDEEFPFDSLNVHPIGSGPYQVSSVSTDSTGAATQYKLVPFSGYALESPYLSSITFRFYPDTATMEKAFDTHEIDAMADISPSDLASFTRTSGSVIEVPLPRVFGVFFNQGHNAVLADASVRQALNDATDRQEIVNKALDGYGVPLEGPLPPGISGEPSSENSMPLSLAVRDAADGTTASSTTASTDAAMAAAARTDLEQGGWTFSTTDGLWEKGKEHLTFTLSTADEPELVASANALAALWAAAGINAQVQIYPLSELNTNVIAPRNYDAVLFGEVVGPTADLYAFWDSSQRNDPGLNLAMYANEEIDTLLTQARATSDIPARNALYEQFAAIIEKDQPAVFLYAPDFLYIVPESIKGITLGALTTPADRFADAYQWYTQTKSVWSIFAGSAH